MASSNSVSTTRSDFNPTVAMSEVDARAFIRRVHALPDLEDEWLREMVRRIADKLDEGLRGR